MTRTRSRGSQAAYFKSGRRRVRYKTGITVGAWQPWETIGPKDEGYHFYEAMTDVIGSSGADNYVSHSSSKADGGIGAGHLTFQTDWSGGFVKSQWECEVSVPTRLLLLQRKDHLGALAGLKALAIARVPAYSASDVQGFLTLMEAKEMSNSAAIKAASALGHLAKSAYDTYKSGRSMRIMTRKSRDALLSLTTKLGSVTPKDAWSAFLAGLSIANNGNMEWKYGWKPMIEQIQAANAVVDKIAALRQRLLDGVRVYGKAVEVRSENFGVLAGLVESSVASAGYWSLQGTKTTKRTCTASIVRKLNPASAMYDVDWFSSLDVVMEMNGLTPSLKSMWQLSHLSFVVDWFWNVSSLLESLESLDAPIGSSFTSSNGLYSEKTETTVEGSLACNPNGNKYTSNGSAVYKTYVRSADPLTGGPAFYIPPLTIPTDVGRWWSMAQLAFQRYVGRRK